MPEEFDPYAEWFGIPPEERPIDHYRLLGVPRFESDPQVLTAAADRRMSDLRRRQTGPRGAFTQKLLNEVAAAKLCLLNQATKLAYDLVLQAADDVPDDDPPPLPTPSLSTFPISVSPPAPARYGTIPPVAPPTPPISANSPPLTFPTLAASTSKHLSSARRTAVGAQPGDEIGPAKPPSRIAAIALGGIVVALLVAVAILFPKIRPPQDPATAGQQNSAMSPLDGPATPGSAGSDRGQIVLQQADGRIVLDASSAELHGSTIRRADDSDGLVIANWSSDDDEVRWRFRVDRLPRYGTFRARIEYQVDDAAHGGSYSVVVDGQPRNLSVRGQGGETWITDEFFLSVSKKGEHTLALRSVKRPGEQLMRLRSLILSVDVK